MTDSRSLEGTGGAVVVVVATRGGRRRGDLDMSRRLPLGCLPNSVELLRNCHLLEKAKGMGALSPWDPEGVPGIQIGGEEELDSFPGLNFSCFSKVS